MGMSMMSGRTNMTEMTEMSVIGEDGVRKKIKKKRSAFGWIKKQFSLSEEEKAAFEERRHRPLDEGANAYARRDQRWVDGRRIR
jgi:hypothetical protein